MKRPYTSARIFFDSARRLAGLKRNLRYWLNPPASRSSAHVEYYGLFYRLMVLEARASVQQAECVVPDQQAPSRDGILAVPISNRRAIGIGVRIGVSNEWR